jgi:hypothetical protein
MMLSVYYEADFFWFFEAFVLVDHDLNLAHGLNHGLGKLQHHPKPF